MNVVVISGGFSEEQHSSRESGRYVAEAIKSLGHTVATVEFDENLIDNIKKISPDIAFPMVQGKNHGDGAVQSLLELLNIPYVGSRPYAAAIINHKTVCKKIWRGNGILTPDFFEYGYNEYKQERFKDFEEKVWANNMTLPVVIKPPTQGSRFGMVFVKDAHSFEELENSFQYDNVLLVEKYIEGRFFTQGIIEINSEMSALPPVEIIDNSDVEFKHYPGGCSVCAHDFTPSQLSEINDITITAAALTYASGFARLDYHLSENKLYLLEINAVPGLIPGYSSMNICAETAGYDYATFIEILLSGAASSKTSHKRPPEKSEMKKSETRGVEI